jgi:hypothetical protein
VHAINTLSLSSIVIKNFNMLPLLLTLPNEGKREKLGVKRKGRRRRKGSSSK